MRNNDRIARRIRLVPPDSPFFTVSGPRPPKKGQEFRDGKIAAGMEACFDIVFHPEERKDYKCNLMCITEREKFIVPGI